VGKSDGKSPLESHSLKTKRELNKELDLQEVGRKSVNRTNLAQEREN